MTMNNTPRSEESAVTDDGMKISRAPVEGYFDFDGVFNAFPDQKILRRGGQEHLDWMAADDLRRELYDSDKTAFLLNGNIVLKVPDGNYRIHWANELACRIRHLMASGKLDVHWLTTWQPYTSMLDKTLGFDEIGTVTEHWYDEDARQGIWTGKKDTIVNRIKQSYSDGKPLKLLWVDDEECDFVGLKAVKEELERHEDDGSVRVMLIRPDDRIGVSRRQFDEIVRFINGPLDFDRLTYDVEPSIVDPYDEMKRSHLGF